LLKNTWSLGSAAMAAVKCATAAVKSPAEKEAFPATLACAAFSLFSGLTAG